MTILIIGKEKCQLACLYCFEGEHTQPKNPRNLDISSIEKTLNFLYSDESPYRGADIGLQ